MSKPKVIDISSEGDWLKVVMGEEGRRRETEACEAALAYWKAQQAAKGRRKGRVLRGPTDEE